MLCIENPHTDAWFNLAAEEYLLKNFSDDILMVWQNEPSIIIGKHQNVWDEINRRFVREKHIKVVRRYSGGGAVYHDEGNLNVTFIENGRQSSGKFTEMLIGFLHSCGIKATADERQGINIDGLKISGSAQSIHKNRILHHATLLFSTNLYRLTEALTSEKPTAKGGSASPNTGDSGLNTGTGKSCPYYVKSVRSPVTNINSYIRNIISIDEFKHILINYLTKNKTDIHKYSFTENDLEAICNLRDNKYATPVWNFNIKT